MTDMNKALLAGLADVLEFPALAPETVLADAAPWDSIAILSALTMIEDVTGRIVGGQALAECVTAADVLALVERTA